MVRVAIIGTAGRGVATMTKQLFDSMVIEAKSVINSLALTEVELISGGAAWSDHVAVALFLQFERKTNEVKNDTTSLKDTSKTGVITETQHCDHAFMRRILIVPFKQGTYNGEIPSDHPLDRPIMLSDLLNPPNISKLTLYLPCKWKNGKHIDTGGFDWKTNPGRSANKYHKIFSEEMGYDTLQQINNAIKKGATMVCSDQGFHARNTLIAKNCDIMIAFSWSDGDTPEEGGTLDTWKKCKAKKIHISLNTLKEK